MRGIAQEATKVNNTWPYVAELSDARERKKARRVIADVRRLLVANRFMNRRILYENLVCHFVYLHEC